MLRRMGKEVLGLRYRVEMDYIPATSSASFSV